MILRSVELENFGKFRDQNFEFRRGLNLVIGPNEAGKSTLAEAIPAVLFGATNLERLKPWGSSRCVAGLVFEEQGRTIHIKRDLVSDQIEWVERDDLYHTLSQFSGKVSPRGNGADHQKYCDLLSGLLGFDDEGLFRATCFFGHTPQQWNDESLSKKLRTLVGGTTEADYAQILERLLDEHFTLTRHSPWGRDKKNDREYETVCLALTELQSQEAATPIEASASADDAEVQQQIDALRAELEEDREESRKGERYIERFRQQVKAEQASQEQPAQERQSPQEPSQDSVETTLQREPESAEDNSSEPEATDDLQTQFVALGLPKNPPPQLPELLAEAAEIRQELAVLQQPLSILSQRENSVTATPWGAAIGLTLPCVLATAGAWWQAHQAFLVSIIAGVCCCGIWGWLTSKAMTRRKVLAQCEQERTRLEKKKGAALGRQAQLSERCEQCGVASSAIDLVRLQKLVKEHRVLLDRWWNKADATETAAPVAAQEQEAPTTLDETSSNESAPVETPSAEQVAEPSPAALELMQMEARLAEFLHQLQTKEERLVELESQQTPEQGATAPVETQTEELQERKIALERRISVLREAINLLAKAVENFGAMHLKRLNKETSQLFAKMTGDRHCEVELDDNMSPRVKVDGRSWRPIDRFSRGTVDALYLSLRVALAKVRGAGRILPLILDDPFVHLDQQRLSQALNLIDLAATDNQLILLSHNQDLGKRAARERWHLVPIDSAAESSQQEGGEDHVGQLHLL
ncbi:MAG: AAA family ATPase [Desulfuromonadales bacterium]|nr:AAA family ATPase [Desulfuromonadales bacterium]